MEKFIEKKSFCESERKQLETFNQFQFPSYIKQIGFGLLIFSFIVLFSIPIFSLENVILKSISKNGILFSMLLIVMSKDKIEDEMTNQLRLQSYKLAFLAGVIYTLVQPYIIFAIGFFIKPEKEIQFEEIQMFPILFFFLAMQILFFYVLKKIR